MCCQLERAVYLISSPPQQRVKPEDHPRGTAQAQQQWSECLQKAKRPRNILYLLVLTLRPNWKYEATEIDQAEIR